MTIFTASVANIMGLPVFEPDLLKGSPQPPALGNLAAAVYVPVPPGAVGSVAFSLAGGGGIELSFEEPFYLRLNGQGGVIGAVKASLWELMHLQIGPHSAAPLNATVWTCIGQLSSCLVRSPMAWQGSLGGSQSRPYRLNEGTLLGRTPNGKILMLLGVPGASDAWARSPLPTRGEKTPTPSQLATLTAEQIQALYVEAATHRLVSLQTVRAEI